MTHQTNSRYGMLAVYLVFTMLLVGVSAWGMHASFAAGYGQGLTAGYDWGHGDGVAKGKLDSVPRPKSALFYHTDADPDGSFESVLLLTDDASALCRDTDARLVYFIPTWGDEYIHVVGCWKRDGDNFDISSFSGGPGMSIFFANPRSDYQEGWPPGMHKP